jgi:hypothetical protein
MSTENTNPAAPEVTTPAAPTKTAAPTAKKRVRRPTKKAATKSTAKSKTKPTTKSATKSATKSPAKAPVKAATKPVSQTSSTSKAKPVAKPEPKAKTKAADTVKPKKPKLVRDSFTFPKEEYQAIAALKQKALGLKHSTKKSEILRAGLMLLTSLNDKAFLAALSKVPALKTGRPAKS